MPITGQDGADLRGRHRLRQRSDKGHGFDSQTWIDGLDLLAQQLRQMRRVARRCRGADANRLPVTVHTLEMKVQASGAGTRLHELPRHLHAQVANDLRNGVRRPYGFEQAQTHARHFDRKHGVYRLGYMAERLIQPLVELTPETLSQRRARGGDQLLDPFETHATKLVCDAGLNAQRRDRKNGKSFPRCPLLNDVRSAGRNEACNCVGAASRICHGNLTGRSSRHHPAENVLEQRNFALEQMGAAGDVQPDAVGGIRRDYRSVALACPQGETAQPIQITFWICIHNVKFRSQRARLGDCHAGSDAETARFLIHSRNDASTMVWKCRDERCQIAFRRPAGLATNSIRRPARQV